jgi:hypothetical protein
MEKGIKIIVIIIVITLLFLLFFNYKRWLRKKGYLNNNKAVKQEIIKNEENNNVSSSHLNKEDIALYIGTFFAAILYNLFSGGFQSYRSLSLTISSNIGVILGTLLIPAIISWVIDRNRKTNDFPLIFLITTIAFLTIAFLGNLSRDGVI